VILEELGFGLRVAAARRNIRTKKATVSPMSRVAIIRCYSPRRVMRVLLDVGDLKRARRRRRTGGLRSSSFMARPISNIRGFIHRAERFEE